ncbi:FMN-binding negative transcriptional regulator [Streptomyces enissocaesilis]|uniref:Transcriptional regulator n=1 Tax=Streptomyces enissocaesilis TaxID=332589 RepID=A0ABN3X9D5_9ACTN
MPSRSLRSPPEAPACPQPATRNPQPATRGPPGAGTGPGADPGAGAGQAAEAGPGGRWTVACPAGQAVAGPTHFTSDGNHLLIHLARPHPVREAVERDPDVTFTVIGDCAFIPGPWRAKSGTPPTDTVPTSYYAAVQFTCRAHIVDGPEGKAELLRRRLAHFQPDGDHAPVTVGRPPYGRMLPGIRGLRLQVTEVRAKFKCDDRSPVEQRAPSPAASPDAARASMCPPHGSSTAARTASAPGKPAPHPPYAPRSGFGAVDRCWSTWPCSWESALPMGAEEADR